MRRFFLTFLFVLIAALALFSLVEKNDGYILLAAGGHTVEMPLLLGAILLLLSYLVITIVFALLRGVISAPTNVSQWVSGQRQRQSLSRTSQGLVAYTEGRWDYARKSLERSAKGSSTPFVNYLFAAKSSSELGDVKAVNAYLQKAEQVGEDAQVAIGLTQAELQMQNGQYEQALATLLRVRRLSHNHPVGSQLLAKVYVELSDWHNLLKLLPSCSKDVISESELLALENRACKELIYRAEKDGELAALQAEWKRISATAKKRLEVITAYVQSLLRNGYANEAESIVRHQLQKSFSSELAELYGMTEDEKPARQLAFAEKQLKSYESDASLLLTAGRLSLKVDERDNAKAYFEKSLNIKHSAAAFAELANLYASAGDYQRSSVLFAKAAMLRGGESPKPLLVDSSAPASPAVTASASLDRSSAESDAPQSPSESS